MIPFIPVGGLGVATLSTGVLHGPWDATRAALRAQIIAFGGLPSTSGSPTFTLGAANAAPTITGVTVDRQDAAFRYGGAAPYIPAAFPDNLGYKFWNVTPDGTTKAVIAGAIDFALNNGSAIELWVKGNGVKMRLSVDGAYTTTQFATLPSDGQFYYYKVDFGASAPTRPITIEYAGDLVFLGVRRETAATIAAPSAATRLRLVVAGDSFTEGTGADAAYDGFVHIAGKRLGFADRWASGSGGTGWEQTLGSRVALPARLTPDVIDRAPDVAMLAMGLNDEGDGVDALVGSDCAAALTDIRTALPAAMIYVVGPWDPSAPSAPPSNRTSIRDVLRAASANRGGVKFLDPIGVAFTKAGGGDTTHPDTPGADTLGTWMASRVGADLGVAA